MEYATLSLYLTLFDIGTMNIHPNRAYIPAPAPVLISGKHIYIFVQTSESVVEAITNDEESNPFRRF